MEQSNQPNSTPFSYFSNLRYHSSKLQHAHNRNSSKHNDPTYNRYNPRPSTPSNHSGLNLLRCFGCGAMYGYRFDKENMRRLSKREGREKREIGCSVDLFGEYDRRLVMNYRLNTE